MKQKEPVLKKKWTVKDTDPLVACDFFSHQTGFSKVLVKKIMTRGGAWILQKNKRVRLRKAKKELRPGNRVEFYFDPSIEPLATDQIKSLLETKFYGVWFKPAGILTHGTNFGDEGSLIRHIEKERREVFPVHRLEREAAGVICVAYNAKAQMALSKIWATKVRKFYQAEVLGDLSSHFKDGQGEIDFEIEEKKATTRFKIISSNPEKSQVEIEILTERKHQIRIHFDRIHHPIMGDPRYGKGNKNLEGMKLLASAMEFNDPFDKSPKRVESPITLF